MLIAGFFMTQQIINVGTGPDSYTGDTLRTAFEKTNSNFDELYALSVANTSADLSVHSVTATGGVTANRFIGDGSYLTGITTTSLGNIVIDGPRNQTITANVNAPMVLKAFRGNVVGIQVENDNSGIVSNLIFAATTTKSIDIFTLSNAVGRFPDITLRSNNAKIVLDGTTNSINFQSLAQGGYSYNFYNGSLYSQDFYSAANVSTGYQFTTPGGLTGMSHTYQNDVNGNISLVRITHDSSVPAKFYANDTTLLAGNLVIIQDGNTAGTFPNAFIQTYSNANTYTQFVWQNLGSGGLSTGDIVITADTGTDTTYYLDMGIAGSGYDNTHPNNSLGTSVYPLDAYIYAQGGVTLGNGGNLVIGTTSVGTDVKVLVGGVNTANVVATFTQRAMTVSGNTVLHNNYVPGSASSSGTAGQIVWDSGYVYVCVANNTWKRANLSTW